MKTTAIFILVLLVFPPRISLTQSLTQTGNDSSEINYLKPGKWAVQFEVGSYVNPRFFENVMFSIKPQISRKTALRLSLSFDHIENDGHYISGNILFPEAGYTNYVTAKLNFQYYFNPGDKAVFYGGFGPIYKYNDEKYSFVSVDIFQNGTYIYEVFTSSKSYSFGGIGLFGVEYFMIKQVSLLAEYNISTMTGKYKYTRTSKNSSPYGDDVTVNVTHENTFEFQFNIVKLGISVYF
jgi:hypothetical protein